MPRKWLPKRWGVQRVTAQFWEPMTGNHPRRGLTLHNEGVDRDCTPGHVHDLARYVVARSIQYHLVWCPVCGKWAQTTPLTAAARSQVGGSVYRGASANKAGTLNVQVCVAGFGSRDFTAKSPMRGAWLLAELLDRYRIPWRARATWGSGASRSVSAWMRGGVQGHQHGPCDDHTDPGRIDVARLFREARRQQNARRRGRR